MSLEAKDTVVAGVIRVVAVVSEWCSRFYLCYWLVVILMLMVLSVRSAYCVMILDSSGVDGGGGEVFVVAVVCGGGVGVGDGNGGGGGGVGVGVGGGCGGGGGDCGGVQEIGRSR